MRLDARAFGLACGVLAAIAGFAATLLSLQRGAGQTISVVSALYFGYSWSFAGALLALFWGLVYGFSAGWLLATVYNVLAGRRGN